jgi:alkanesulfonate monooxygenase SsuD/methylene tetrahydromethanopterin reductase-like flavin-dependent oxidoreductase (luciferase family)
MIQFGIVIPQENLDYEAVRRVAYKCEKLGFDSIWVYDHVFWSHKTFLEAWTVLSALAVQTNKLRLGPLVINNSLRSPSLLAKMATTLDIVSEGRLEFGIGAGTSTSKEYFAYGIPFEKPAERIERLREALHIIKKLWIEEKPTFQGRYYTITNAFCYPKPFQKPHPPIWISGRGEELMLKVVAEHADGWNFTGSPEEYIQKVRILEKHCSLIGRRAKSIRRSWHGGFLITQDIEKVKRLMAESPSFNKYINRIHASIIGTHEHCLEEIKKYVDLGVTYFMLSLPFAYLYTEALKSLNLFSKQIMPFFKE